MQEELKSNYPSLVTYRLTKWSPINEDGNDDIHSHPSCMMMMWYFCSDMYMAFEVKVKISLQKQLSFECDIIFLSGVCLLYRISNKHT